VKKLFITVALAAMWALLASGAQASLLFVPNTYGLSARSVGMGNAMTAVGDDYSMTFFNPGALGALETNQLDLGYLYASPRFTGGPKNGGGDVDFDTCNRITLIGFTMNLSTLFEKEQGLGLGFDLAVDNNMKSFLAFEETRDDDGQFIRYGLSSVTMVTALGVRILPQLHVGLGGFVLVKGKNTMVTKSDLTGETQEEEILVDAEPAIAPIVGIFAPITPKWTLGAVYRGKGVAEFSSIEANADAMISESSLTTLNLLMAFKDTYVPQQVALGAGFRPTPELLIALDGTWANWADYEDEIKKGDVVRDDSEIETRDIIIPRIGVEYAPLEDLFLRLGYYYEETPFESPGVGDTVVLDNAKHVFSFGLAYDVTQINALSFPVTIGASYFNHYLVPRTVENNEGREYASSGDLHGVIGTMTLRF